MPQISPLVDAYIDANIILVAAFAVLCLMRWGLRRAGHGDAHLLHLRLTEGMLAAAVLSPFVAYGLTVLASRLWPGVPMNAADFAVAQFLDGRVKMDAVTFESLMGTRRRIVEDIVYLDGALVRAGVTVFALGFLASLWRTGSEILRLRRLIEDSFVWRRFGRVDLRLSDSARMPFSTRGIFRRHIVIPSDLLTQPDILRIALAHELQHMRRGDTEWEVALVVLRPLFFWNPVFGAWKRKLEALRELGCDAAVLERRRVSPRDYADCLLKVCHRGMGDPASMGRVAPRVPFLEIGQSRTGRRNHAALVRRVSAIASAKGIRRASAVYFWPILIVAGLTIGLGAASLQRQGDWSQDRLMLSTVVNLERLETRNVGLSLEGF